MSFFKKTFKKAKKGVTKTAKKVGKVADKGAKEVKNVADKGTKEVKNAVDKGTKEVKQVAEQGVDKLEQGADIAKEGLTEAGDFVLNSSDREYWHKEISQLRSRSNELREELNHKINTYYEVRIDYQQKIHRYITMGQDTIALGLVASDKLNLNQVTDTAGAIVDAATDFNASSSEIEAVGRYTLGFVSGGISDIVFASQEAKKEAKHLKQQISQLEASLAEIDRNISNHQQGIVLIDRSVTEILQLYGEDTTMDNFVFKQCELIYARAKEAKVRETMVRMQNKGVNQSEIAETTANV